MCEKQETTGKWLQTPLSKALRNFPVYVFSKPVTSTIAIPKTLTLQNTAHVQAAELLFDETLLPASPFLQAQGLHFALGARAQPWAWETETPSSEGQSFCYFCTSFSNPDEVAKTDQMKAMVNFHLFGPKKSHEKLDFVVCGVTIRLRRHLHCCNHTVQETAVH